MFEKLFRKHLNPWRIRQAFILIAGLNILAALIILPIIAVLTIYFNSVGLFSAASNWMIDAISAVAFAFMLVLVADYISPIWPRSGNEGGDKND